MEEITTEAIEEAVDDALEIDSEETELEELIEEDTTTEEVEPGTIGLVEGYGSVYIVILALISAGVLLNIFTTIRALIKGGNERAEYAGIFIKVFTIVFLLFISAWCFLNAGVPDYTATVVAIHMILGIATAADALFLLIVKLIFWTKK